MHITIKRTKRRKTIMIQVKDSLVEVRAPSNLKQKEIDSFILQKENWINQKLLLQRSIKKPIKKKFKNKEIFQFLGKDRKLKIIINNNKKSHIDDDFIYLVFKNLFTKLLLIKGVSLGEVKIHSIFFLVSKTHFIDEYIPARGP